MGIHVVILFSISFKCSFLFLMFHTIAVRICILNINYIHPLGLFSIKVATKCCFYTLVTLM